MDLSRKRDCIVRVAKTEALISFAIMYSEADLRLCFRVGKKSRFFFHDAAQVIAIRNSLHVTLSANLRKIITP